MRMRRLQWLGPLVAVAMVAFAGPAFGAQAPLRNVSWTEGAQSPFAGTRLDGQYDKADGRIYFLGYRLLDGSTNGEVWYYDVAAKTYTDTGVAMPVPISNYQIAALTDPNGLGLYVFGGRDSNGNIVNTTQVYYPATNTTAVLDTDPWPGTTPLGCISLPAEGVATVGDNAYVLVGCPSWRTAARTTSRRRRGSSIRWRRQVHAGSRARTSTSRVGTSRRPLSARRSMRSVAT
jgi:hypothetical protein